MIMLDERFSLIHCESDTRRRLAERSTLDTQIRVLMLSLGFMNGLQNPLAGIQGEGDLNRVGNFDRFEKFR